MTSAYTAYDAAHPVGGDTGPNFATYTKQNLTAVWYGVMSGALPGYAYSQTTGTGTAEQPQYQYWTHAASTNIVRHTNTWTSGNLTTIVVDVSQDSGANYASVATVTQNFDASGFPTTTSGGSLGFLGWLSYLLRRVKDDITALATHAALTGTSAHGLGTISTQASSSVTITGGTINSVAIGGSTPAAGTFTRASETRNSTSSTSLNLDWLYGGTDLTNTGTITLNSNANIPSNVIATHLVRCPYFEKVTWVSGTNWGTSGKPSLTGPALVSLVTTDSGTNVYAAVIWN